MEENGMSWKTREFWLAILLVVYLLAVAVAASASLVVNFPTGKEGTFVFPRAAFFPFGGQVSTDQGFILIAMFAGIAGSFLHTGQSLISYIGNGSFKASWAAWYFLRPWIGGVLGLAIYFTFRSGLISGAGAANPYGVVALGLLGGWFSKTTTDKLQEVFTMLFKTDEDKGRKHKLDSGAALKKGKVVAEEKD